MLLAGKTVLEWTSGISGAFCARVLADLGAEVIKIEHPAGGDPMRREGPHSPGSAHGESPLFAYVNHGKRSITLDPNTPSGFALLERLAGKCDLLIETELSAAPPEKTAALREANPRLAILSLTPVGKDAPLAGVEHTLLTLQHRSGYALHQALPVTDTRRQPPVGCADREAGLVVGVAAAISALWALLVSETANRGPHVDFSIHDFFAAHLYPGPLAEWCEGEREFRRSRAEFGGTEVAGGLVWMVECADGWIMVSPREQHQWARWVKLLGDPGWSKDTALCGDRNARRTNYVALQELMSETTRHHTRQALYDLARAERVACFPVSDAADILESPQLAARRFFDSLPTGAGQALAVPGLPFEVTTDQGALERARSIACPRLGGANDEILRGRLGLSPDTIEQMLTGGAV